MSNTIHITGKGFDRTHIEIPVGTLLYFNNASSAPVTLCGGSHQICSTKESTTLKLPVRGLTIAAGKKGAINFFDEDSNSTYSITLGKLGSRSFSNADLQVVVQTNNTDNSGSSISVPATGGSSGVPSSGNDDDNGGSSGAPSSGSDDGGGGSGGDGGGGAGGGGGGE